MEGFRISSLILNYIIPVLLWIHTSSSDPKLSDNMRKTKILREKILNGYDKTIPPTRQDTTSITIFLLPRLILEVDEEKGLFELSSTFAMVWNDPRMALNKTTQFNRAPLKLPQDKVWLPNINIFNGHHSQMTHGLARTLRPDIMNWYFSMVTTTSCPALSQVADDPYNVVTCVVKIGSWVHDGCKLDFYHSTSMHMYEFQNSNPRWELLVDDNAVMKNVTYYKGLNQTYVSVDHIFHLRRRPLPEIEATRIPCILVMLLDLSMFWMPTDSSKKLLVGGTSFLALVILMLFVAWSWKFRLGVLLAASFLRSTMYIVVVSILLQVLIIFNLCSISRPSRPPAVMTKLLRGPFGKYACVRLPTSDDNIPVDRIQQKDEFPRATEPPTSKEDWMLFAAGLDRVFFILMSIIMIAVHHLCHRVW